MLARSKPRRQTGRIKTPSFVPTVCRITPENARRIAGLEAVVAHWTGKELSSEEWLREPESRGLFLGRGDEVLGFLLYGAKDCLPGACDYPVGPLDEGAALLAYVEGDGRACRRLIVRMLRELRGRGVGKVEAVASDFGLSRHIPTNLLLQSGWRPVRRGWRRGSPYTLLDLDLGSAIEAGDLARLLLGRVRLPNLGVGGVPAPAFWGTATGGRNGPDFAAQAPRS